MAGPPAATAAACCPVTHTTGSVLSACALSVSDVWILHLVMSANIQITVRVDC